MPNHSLVIALLAGACLGCGSESEPLPSDLLQVWRTNAPGYRDRSFEIREGWVLFGTSKYAASMHPIEHVESTGKDSGREYTIRYRMDDGGTLSVLLLHKPGDPDRLRIGHRDHVWVPESHAHWLKEEAL